MRPTVEQDLNTTEAARILGINRRDVKKLCERGLLKSYVANPLATRQLRRITMEALNEFREANRVVPA